MCLYLLDWTPRYYLFHYAILCGYYSRAVFIKLGTEDEEIHWLLMPERQSEETLPCTLATATDTELAE